MNLLWFPDDVIIKCPWFNSRNQRDGESVEQYVVDLHCLARNCNFGALTEDLITDNALSRTLQLDPELTLEKVTKRVRQTEAVQQQQQSALKETSSCKELVEIAALSKKTDSGSSVMLIVVAVVGNIEEASAQRSMLCVSVATREAISNPAVSLGVYPPPL